MKVYFSQFDDVHMRHFILLFPRILHFVYIKWSHKPFFKHIYLAKYLNKLHWKKNDHQTSVYAFASFCSLWASNNKFGKNENYIIYIPHLLDYNENDLV